MKLIDSTVERVLETDPVRLIEIAGRTCYKSEDRMNADSAIAFFNSLAKRKHFAMLEHGTATFKIDGLEEYHLSPRFLSTPYLKWSYVNNVFYITLSGSHIVKGISNRCTKFDTQVFFQMSRLFLGTFLNIEPSIPVKVCSSYTVELIYDISYEDRVPFQVIAEHKFLSYKFICDRGVSHELVRHRCSVAQESQRYCNYANDKFGAEVVFVKPSDWDTRSESQQKHFETVLTHCEEAYLQEIASGLSPQMARALLPNATKTEVVLTMNIEQWLHFVDLRSRQTTGKAHPDTVKLARTVQSDIQDRIDNISNM